MTYYQHKTLSEAAKTAVSLADKWSFQGLEEFYDQRSLQGVAEIHDEEAGVDEDSFYVVSPEGAIGLCEDEETVDWLFIPVDSTEELPSLFNQKKSANFCATCGNPVGQGAKFCGACGAKL